MRTGFLVLAFIIMAVVAALTFFFGTGYLWILLILGPILLIEKKHRLPASQGCK